MNKPNRLRLVLQKLEDQLFSFRVYVQGSTLINITPQTNELRQVLASGDNRKIAAMCQRMTQLKDECEERSDEYLKSASLFLMGHFTILASWLTESQRIYAPSPRLVELLLGTKLPDFDPSEINFVANSFAVQLPEPMYVEGSDLGVEHDFIVCNHTDTGLLSGTSYTAAAYEKYKPLTVQEKRQLLKTTATGRINSLLKMQKRFGDDETLSYVVNPKLSNTTYEQLVATFQNPDVTFVYKIIMGINLYLQSCRKKDIEVVTKLPKAETRIGKEIDSEASLFSLETTRIVPQRPDDYDTESGRSLPYHFREAYWRRPKGTGHIPEAPKTEWVTSTWVRQDLRDQNPHVGKIKPVD